MRYYCGLDLSSRDCQVCVIQEDLDILIQKKVRNELPIIVKLIEPYKDDLKIVTVFYEAGNIDRFKDARHFSSYCRLVPGMAQSGKSVRRCFDRHMRRHKGRARKLICYDRSRGLLQQLRPSWDHWFRAERDQMVRMLVWSVRWSPRRGLVKLIVDTIAADNVIEEGGERFANLSPRSSG